MTSPVAARDDAGPRVEIARACGRLDRVIGGTAHGWAADPGDATRCVRVEVRAGPLVLGEGRADVFDEALARAGIGDGGHAFRIALDTPFTVGATVELTLHDASSGRPLVADAFRLACRDPAVLDERELDGRSALVRTAPAPPVDRRLAPGFRKAVKRAARRTRRRLEGGLVVPFERLARRAPIRPPASGAARVPHPGAAARLAWLDEASSSGRSARAECWPELTLPAVDDPQVSVVIPVHDQFALTYQCLVSLILGAGAVSFEVLLVDDRSGDATREIESRVRNLRVIRNERNLGFLLSCRRAADEARGEFLVFLNNDTEVGPGWLDELRDVFGRFDGVGAVGAKLVYPDGRLQDAGGIVWESGTPWNVGHGRDPDDPEFGYVREVDYLTGAALMVERAAWDAVGGFGEEYAPAYYEDTDLAFKLRAHGYRTLYCPQATVVHHEGRSNGTSLDAGVKRHQVINAARFKERWRESFAGLGAEGVDLRRNKDRERGLRVLVIDHEYPRLGHDAGSYAAVQEMRLLLGLGCKVTFLPRNLQWAGTHVDTLQRLGIECVHAPWCRSTEQFLADRGGEFDAVYVTRYSVAEDVLPSVRRHSDAKVLFNNADLHFLREMRGALARGSSELGAVRRTRARELAVMSSVDAVLSYSDVERTIIASHLLRDDHVFACPWVLDAEPSRAPLESRRGIAFLGGFGHPPNREAMDWFVERVMPLLQRTRPDITLHVWGSRLPSDAGWEGRDGVVVEGYAETLEQVFDSCRVFVAPLRSGAGIKGKVLDSVARGVPTVLSPLAAEGTGLVHGLDTLIATSPQEWAARIVELVDDAALWRRVSDASLELAAARYSRAHGLDRLRGVFDALGLETRTHSRQVIAP